MAFMLRLETELEESHPRKEEWPVQSTEVQGLAGLPPGSEESLGLAGAGKDGGWLGRVIEAVPRHTCVKIHPALGREQLRGEVRVVTWTPMKDLKQELGSAHWRGRTERGLFMA